MSAMPDLMMVAGFAGCVFFGISLLLHYFPSILHGRQRRYAPFLYRIRHIAHRGGREDTPENTLPAFANALEHESDMLELDVWLTADEEVVVHHDPTVGRMTGAKAKTGTRISDIHSDNLPSVKLPTDDEWDHGYGGDWGPKGKSDGMPSFPLLREVFAAVPPGTPFIIEFKLERRIDLLIDKVHAMLLEEDGGGASRKRKDNVVWFSLEESINRKLKAKDPDIPQIVSAAAVLRTTLLFFAGLLPFTGFKEDIYGTKIGGINTGLIRDVGGPFKLLPEPVVKALAWLAETLLATSAGAIAAHFHRRGIPTFFLGVNDEKTLQGAAKAGAHAMLTDRPEWFSQQIKKSGAKLFRPVVRPR